MEMARRTKWLLTGAACLGAAVGAAGIAGAATGTSTAADGSSSTSVPAAQAQDPATQPGRPNETALTGDTANKVRAAAEAAVPGGTVLRVETDSDGSPYEAHVRKADGTEVTVKIDSNFQVTETVEGGGRNCGPGGRDGGPNGGTAPGAQGEDGTSTNGGAETTT
jgi:hypothetical protein